MLQQDEPEDYVIATGQTHTVREFCERAFARAGIELANGEGRGLASRGRQGDRAVVVEIDPRYLRPTEVELLLGDASKAKEKLGWAPRTTFAELVDLMVDADLALAANEGESEWRALSATTDDDHFWTDRRVLLTGGNGFLGTFIRERIESEHPEQLLTPRSTELDLRDARAIADTSQTHRPESRHPRRGRRRRHRRESLPSRPVFL